MKQIKIFIILIVVACSLTGAKPKDSQIYNELAKSFGPGFGDAYDSSIRSGGPTEIDFGRKGSLQSQSFRDVELDSEDFRLKSNIVSLFKHHARDLDLHYASYFKKDSSLSGVITTIKFTIAPSGIITKIEILSSTTSNPVFDHEILTRVKAWLFPKVKSGNTTVIFPLNFNFIVDLDEHSDSVVYEESHGTGHVRAPKLNEIHIVTDPSIRSELSIMRVIDRNIQRLRYIYLKYQKVDHRLSGDLTLRLTIYSSGMVENVVFTKATTGNSTFENEVLEYVKQWKFELIKSGNTTVTIPFTFSE